MLLVLALCSVIVTYYCHYHYYLITGNNNVSATSESCTLIFLEDMLTIAVNILKPQINFFSHNSTSFCLKRYDLKILIIIIRDLCQ